MSTRIAIIILALLLLPAIVGPIVIGVLLERGVEGVVEQAFASGVEVEFDRGLYQSTATTRIPSAEPGGPGLVARHVIVHGPLPLAAPAIGRSPFDLVVVLVKSTIDPDETGLPGIADALEGQPLLTVDTRVTSVGDVDADVMSPGFEYEAGQLVWGGVEGLVTVRDSGQTVGGELASAGLRLGAADASFTAHDGELSFSADLAERRLQARLEQTGAEWVIGDQRIEAGRSVIEADQPFGRDLFGASSSIWSVDRIVGKGGLGQSDFVITALEVEQSVTSDDATGLHDARLEFSLATWSVDGATADGPAGLMLALERVDRAGVEHFREALRKLESSGKTPEEIEAMRPFVLLEQLPAVLASAPVFDVRDFFIEGPEGRLHGDVHLTVDASQPELLGDPFMLMNSLEASARMKGPESLFRRMVDRFAPDPEPRPDAAAEPGVVATSDTAGHSAQAAAVPADRVDTWLEDGTVVREGDDVSFEARFEGGLPTLNGAPADPSLLMGLMPGF